MEKRLFGFPCPIPTTSLLFQKYGVSQVSIFADYHWVSGSCVGGNCVKLGDPSYKESATCHPPRLEKQFSSFKSNCVTSLTEPYSLLPGYRSRQLSVIWNYVLFLPALVMEPFKQPKNWLNLNIAAHETFWFCLLGFCSGNAFWVIQSKVKKVRSIFGGGHCKYVRKLLMYMVSAPSCFL